jgi:hypothetical protein
LRNGTSGAPVDAFERSLLWDGKFAALARIKYEGFLLARNSRRQRGRSSEMVGADSLGLRAFLGIGPTEATPVDASMTIIRKRLSESVFDRMFVFVLSLLEKAGLVRGKSVAIDATTLEANAATKSIVRKETAEDWKQYLQGLAKAEGIENPTEDLRRLDRSRENKKI